VRHGRSAALVAPFKPKDAALFAVLSSFDAAYTAYNGFQQQIERYWCLKHLQQTGQTELTASTLRDGLVRTDALPLVLQALGCENLERGTAVRIRVTGIDLMTLELHASFVERLAPADGPADAEDSAETDDDEAAAAAPVTIAVDLSDAEAPATP
jgi:exoribonuclease-2